METGYVCRGLVSETPTVHLLKKKIKNPTTTLVDVCYYIEPILLGTQSYLVIYECTNIEYGW